MHTVLTNSMHLLQINVSVSSDDTAWRYIAAVISVHFLWTQFWHTSHDIAWCDALTTRQQCLHKSAEDGMTDNTQPLHELFILTKLTHIFLYFIFLLISRHEQVIEHSE